MIAPDVDAELERIRRERKAREASNGHAKGSGAKHLSVSTAAILRTKIFEAIKYIVPGYIAEGCTLLAGRPKLGKSWMMLDIGLAVAGGCYCLGDTECEQGDVLYLALEDNERRLQSRMTKLIGFANEWPARFHYATEWPRADAGGLEEICKWIASVEKPRLVVVDILAMFRSPRRKDQQPYESDYAAIQGLQAIASENGVAVVVVHHLRKSAGEVDPFEKVSGTLGLSGAADTVLILDRDGQGCTLYGRGRDIEEIERAIEFDRQTCRWRVLGEAVEVRRTAERGAILDVLKEADEPLTPGAIAISTGMSRNNVDQLLFKMAKDGDVLKAKRGCYIHPDRTDLIADKNADKNDKNDKKPKADKNDKKPENDGGFTSSQGKPGPTKDKKPAEQSDFLSSYPSYRGDMDAVTDEFLDLPNFLRRTAQ
jgi:hypothetical protein